MTPDYPCHGLNTADQSNQSAPTNPPQALHDLLVFWKSWIFSDSFENENVARWSGFAP